MTVVLWLKHSLCCFIFHEAEIDYFDPEVSSTFCVNWVGGTKFCLLSSTFYNTPTVCQWKCPKVAVSIFYAYVLPRWWLHPKYRKNLQPHSVQKHNTSNLPCFHLHLDCWRWHSAHTHAHAQQTLNLHCKGKSVYGCQLRDVNTFTRQIHTKWTSAPSTACLWMCQCWADQVTSRMILNVSRCQVSLHFPFQQSNAVTYASICFQEGAHQLPLCSFDSILPS